MLAIGCLLAIWRATRVSRRASINPNCVIDAGLIIVIAGLFGARLAYVALNWNLYSNDLASIAAVWDGGLTFYGGLAAGALAGIIWARIADTSIAAFADITAPSIALGYAVARIGCFLNGCCYGCPTSLPWGIRFQADGSHEITPPSHPTQIYSSLLSLLVFWGLTRLEKHNLPSGALFGCWLILSGIERYFIENFRRGATASALVGNLTQAQGISLLLILTGALIITTANHKAASNA